MKHLFVCGAPRSGTTAMWRLLTADARIVMGVERYGNLFFKTPLTPSLFTSERFAQLEPGDTFYDDLVAFNPYYNEVGEKIQAAIYVGDKIPLLYKYLDQLFEHIPDARVIFLVRNIFDVAASYEARADNLEDHSWSRDRRTSAAIRDWNSSLHACKKYIHDERILPVVYEQFFSGTNCLDQLYKFLDLDQTDVSRDAYASIVARSIQLEQNRRRALSQHNVQEIILQSAFGPYREIISSIGCAHSV